MNLDDIRNLDKDDLLELLGLQRKGSRDAAVEVLFDAESGGEPVGCCCAGQGAVNEPRKRDDNEQLRSGSVHLGTPFPCRAHAGIGGQGRETRSLNVSRPAPGLPPADAAAGPRRGPGGERR
jgi:hypothetical protein